MSDAPKTELEKVISKLMQERDALQVQMHLAGMDAKDEYNRISDKVDEVSRQYEPVKDAIEESAGNVFSALGLAADELLVGLGRIRDAIEESNKE